MKRSPSMRVHLDEQEKPVLRGTLLFAQLGASNGDFGRARVAFVSSPAPADRWPPRSGRTIVNQSAGGVLCLL